MKKKTPKKTPKSKKSTPQKERKSILKKKSKPRSTRKTARAKKAKRSGLGSKKISKQTPPVVKAKPPGDLIGQVTHYFPPVHAAVVKVKKGTLRIGDLLYFKGHTTDFKETLQSMQLDHVSIHAASKGNEVGIGVSQRVREGDSVFKIKP